MVSPAAAARRAVTRRSSNLLALSLLFGSAIVSANPQVFGIVRADELYFKQQLLKRLGISQKFWDKMRDDGLPFSKVGRRKVVAGKDLIEHLSRQAERKRGT